MKFFDLFKTNITPRGTRDIAIDLGTANTVVYVKGEGIQVDEPTYVAINKKTGRKIMLLGQSYMPSQEFHILKSYENINPWYFVEDEVLKTPEWTFEKGSLMEF